LNKIFNERKGVVAEVEFHKGRGPEGKKSARTFWQRGRATGRGGRITQTVRVKQPETLRGLQQNCWDEHREGNVVLLS